MASLRRSVLIALVLVAWFASPSSATTLTPTDVPLPGSSFQGADGNQADAPPLVDWATLQAGGRVTHAPDDNAQDTAFAGGHELQPDGWTLGTEAGGVNPAQANILDAWSAVDDAGSETFLYLAFAREAGTGSSFLTFELNRDDRLWRNGAGATIPCRLEGDLLITFEPHGNDADVTVTIRSWHTESTDPASGCARTGSLSPAAGFTVNVDAQGAANPEPIANSLPGVSGATLAAREFGEVALNLGTLLEVVLGEPCGAYTSVWMHSRSSPSDRAALQDFVAPQALDVRRCSAAGTKWLDLNADGERQGGDIGLEGFRVYADLDDNGRYDRGEPFAITDAQGDYVVDDIRATGSYTLREEPTPGVPVAGPWTCSHPTPCSWTVSAADEPYARDRDFGNWRPARITLVKKLDPPDDPGRFDLSVGSDVLRGAGHGDEETFAVKPGTYTVSERAADGTDAADYTSSVACTGPLKRSAPRLRGVSTDVSVLAGESVECTFVNARVGVPSIAIDKIPPPPTVIGDALVYRFVVSNTGSIPFAAADVRVRDPRCDDDPRLVEQADATPESLDPGDQWTYGCQVATELPADPDDCESKTVRNRATVTAPGAEDADDSVADLFCPPQRNRSVRIVKLAPTTAEAGTPLTYRMYVTNTGEAPFAAEDVVVSDPACDAPPTVAARYADGGSRPDASPGALDAGDVWIFECTRATAAPGAACAPFTLDNTAGVVASTPNRPDVDDSDTATTSMTCAPVPPAPPAPLEPPPGQSGVLPDEASVPEAGTAGRARLGRLRRCLRRGSRVVIRGSRIASVRVFVGGRRVGGLRVRALQDRAVIRLRRTFKPGRYRASAVVRFQRGAATPPIRLTRTVRICAPPRDLPRFTG